MALTFTFTQRYKEGKYTKVAGTIAFDTSYPTGGESYASGLAKVLHLDVKPAAGYVFSPDYTNQKILAYYADYDAVADGALIQVPDTTDVASALAAVPFEATLA